MSALTLRSVAFVASLLISSSVAVVAAPRQALAASKADPAAVEKVTALNRKALEAYEAEDYAGARSLLKEALSVCASSGLDQHPITARTHIHLGVVTIVGFKQRDAGLAEFRKALAIQPEIKLTKSLATPDMEKAFDEASSGGGDAFAEEGAGAAAQQGDEDEEGAPAKSHAKKSAAHPKKGDGDEEGAGEGAAGAHAGSLFFALAIGSGFGLVSGDAALDPHAHTLAGAGFAVAQLGQVAPEVGYFLSRDLLLSGALRFQYVTGVNGKASAGCSGGFCDPGTYALAGFAKATWLLGEGPLRFTVGGEIGGGYIRHVVKFPADTSCSASLTSAKQQCVDTLDGGPFLIGPTAGFFYALGESLDLTAAINSALGVPHFTLNFDVQVGIAFRL